MVIYIVIIIVFYLWKLANLTEHELKKIDLC